MAKTSTRALWKGAISFGLVHIPVALHSATADTGIDFDWLDKRSMDPVGYKRINKKTGKEIAKDDIVKGIQYEDGQYVVLTEEEIRAAYPKATQTIEIEAFVPMTELPFVYLDRPYYLSPVGKGDKVYALLRETLLRTGRAGIARVVIQTKQHLAALVPSGPALILNLLRWGDAIRPWDQLDLPPPGEEAVGLKKRELDMAEQLVDDMTTHWDPSGFRDSFAEEVMALVHKKVDAGETEQVVKPDAEEERAPASNIVDLTELLQRSLRRGGEGRNKPEKAPARAPAAKRTPRASTKAKATNKRKAA
ncbi:Ku protein [Piscinibacter sp.]|uniref:non-homologous end joining protein Ku n=1 Tax=Piscinibacter sp. TaxID=1903157 RepID=UPI002CA82E97|nr:Ku protein [Albitalea sp.]HUG24788.1 Ku protein [Albitalea sp.]